MNAKLLALVFTLAAFGPACAAARDKPADSAGNDDEKIAQLQKLLADTMIDTKAFPRTMSLAKFLAAVEGQLPRENKISLRLDGDALGREAPAIAGTEITLPARSGKKTFDSILRKALDQVKAEVDYGIRADGVVITRSRQAAHRMVYDVRDVMEQMPLLLPNFTKREGDVYQDLKTTDGPALLVRLLMNGVDMRPWETIEILNGSRLSVLASPSRHLEIIDLFAALRRLSDVAVVMNARLYEVDRAFFTRQVAPLFAGDKDAEERPAIVRIDGPLLKKITRQKLLLESEDVKIRPRQKTALLSRYSVFRFADGPRRGKEERTRIGTGLAGVSFEVRPLVSADRRYLRLRITQRAAQLVGIGKTQTLDESTGKTVEVEAPNLRKTSRTGIVQIPDAGPILMAVDYRPPGEEGKDKVWLLVARPFIWIGEEVREIRRGGGDVSPKAIWDSAVPKEEEAAPATRLRLNDEVKEVLQAVITDVLTNPNLKTIRDDYGTPKDKTFTLVDSEKLGWPKGLRPETHGYKLIEVRPDPFVNRRRVLGIRLDKFDLKQKKTDLFDTPIEVCLFNAGGNANSGVIGGCSIFYEPKRAGKRWTVDYVGLRDP